MRAITILLNVVGYLWCVIVGISVGYSAAVTATPINLRYFGVLVLIMVPGLAAITVSYCLSAKSKRKT